MVTSAFGALSATKVGATSYTLTLSSTNNNPAPGQQYTLSGRLTDSSGNGVPNAPIDIFYRFVGGSWQFSNTIYTGANGRYSTSASSSQNVVLQTGYKVGSTYAASSNTATITLSAPTLSLSSTTTTPAPGESYTLSGRLTDSSGNGLAYKPIDIYYHFPGAAWQFSNTIYTGSDGKYSTTVTSSQTVILQTGYKVGGVYVASSNVVTITVQKMPTYQVSISGSTTLHDGDGGTWTVTVLMNGVAVPQSALVGKVTWYIDNHLHYTNGPPGTPPDTLITDANGSETTWAGYGAHTLRVDVQGYGSAVMTVTHVKG